MSGKPIDKGSEPRCHLIVDGTPAEVAGRLNKLIAPLGQVTTRDKWMPEGSRRPEAELHKADCLLPKYDCDQLKAWWFRIVRGHQKAPSFDIASTCTVEERQGILLIEAKAHDKELRAEKKGKPLGPNPSVGESTNHVHIGKAIAWASERLIANTNLCWGLSRDSHYQMSNRFASACKLTELGYPVILVYLGFRNASEMKDCGLPIASHDEWEKLVKSHSKPLFSRDVWGKSFSLHNQDFIPLIRSVEIALDHHIDKFEVE